VVRRAIVRQVRRLSEAGKRSTAAHIMDVTPEAIEQALRSAGVARMIHGHTHRPARHELDLDGHRGERWVLPDWDFEGGERRGGYLRVAGREMELVDLV
jgi:UDP-2,3-diacylglucosamine hydrolase